MPEADIRKVGLFTIRENRVLLCQKMQGPLILPGGKREAGEASLDTLTRELKEELGDGVTLIEPVQLGVYFDRTLAEPPSVSRTIEIELYGAMIQGTPLASNEIQTLVWFSAGDSWHRLAPSLSGQIFPDLIRRGLLGWQMPSSVGTGR